MISQALISQTFQLTPPHICIIIPISMDERRNYSMVKSMTGFGRHELSTEEYRISAEMKAVNHRYLDLSVKMPRNARF